MRVFSVPLLILSLLVLNSCGFHLRGTGGYELDVESINVSAANSYGEFSRELEAQITAQGIALLDSDSAEYAVSISSERSSRRAVATSGNITVSEYELRLETNFSVVSQAGEILIPVTELFVERSYRFDRNSLVGASEEEALLMEEMRRDIAQQLMRRFAATLRKRSGYNSGETESLPGIGPDQQEHLEEFEKAGVEPLARTPSE